MGLWCIPGGGVVNKNASAVKVSSRARIRALMFAALFVICCDRPEILWIVFSSFVCVCMSTLSCLVPS